MESIKAFLRKIDPFGVPFSFKYKSKQNYTTSTGGLFLFIFIAFALIVFVYYFIPFYERKNITAVYYTLILPYAERINFAESKSSLAFGFNCWTANDGTTADQLLKVEFVYHQWKLEDNDYKRTITQLGSHFCTKEDFYNQFNETFEGSKIYNYHCLDDPSITIEGIWTSEIFSYLQIEVNAINKSQELLDKIDNYLLENDCKLQIFYSDNTVDIADYKDPIKSYVEASFIQLNPTLSIRRNIYFMNQYLYDDDFLVSVFHDENEVSIKRTLFSRTEEYSLFQGLKRQKNSTDYLNFAKVYLRADTKKTEIKRKYQKIAEFYADASSLLLTIFNVLIVMFGFLNKFWGEQNLYNKLFFFQDLNLNISNKEDKIKKLIFATDLNNNINLKSSPNTTIIDEKNDKIEKNEKNEYNNTIKNFRNEKIKISNLKGKYTSKNLNNLFDKLPENEQNIGDFDFNNKNNNEKMANSYQEKAYKEEYKEYNVNSINKFNNININTKINNNFLVETIPTTEKNIYNLTTTNDNVIKTNKELVKIKYEYNLLDFIKTIFSKCKCKCYDSKNLKIKNALTERANLILYHKLDIALYIRNMLLFDIMKDILLDSETKDITNFLVHPIISLSVNEETELPSLHHKYAESDFDKFYQEIIKLSNKDEKTIEEIRLMSLSNKHLKELYS